MNRTRKQWQKADADDLSKFANQAFHAITNAKDDIEELHEENAHLRRKLSCAEDEIADLRAQVAALVAAL